MAQNRADAIKEAKQFLESRWITIRELSQQYPQRVSFTPLAGVERDLSFHTCGEKHPIGSYQIKDCVLVGAHGVIGTMERKFLREQNGHLVPEESFLAVPSPCKDEVVPDIDSLVSLLSAAAYCFYHWFLDSLPKVLIAELTGFKGQYLVPADNVNPWVAETMEMMGVDRSRLLPMTYAIVGVKELWIPTHFFGYALHYTPQFAGMFRGFGLEVTKNIKFSYGERVFVPRRPPVKERRIINEQEVSSLLSSMGFAEVSWETLPVMHQIAIAGRATAMVGPHGAGMLHGLFMPPRSLVCELFPPTLINYCTAQFVKLFRHHYIPLVSPVDGPYQRGKDIMVDCEVLKWLLDGALQRSD